MRLEYVQPGALHHAWEDIEDDLRECLKVDDTNVWMQDVYALLKFNQMMLHMALNDVGMNVGWLISQVQQDPHDGERKLMVVYVSGESVYEVFEPKVQELAKSLGCATMAFRSPRRAWLKLAPRMGYDIGHIEFSKEVR